MLKKSVYLIIALILCFCLVSCGESTKTSLDAEINANSSEKEVYLLEGNEYTPYVLVSENYNGNILLLRKYIMDEDQAISDYSSEYEDSHIDKFLRSDFLNLFDVKTREKMTESDVEVTSKEALYAAGKQTYTIKRKAFLLSFSETNCGEHGMAASEGNSLSYFSSAKKRIALKGNDAYSWWLRTPYTGYESVSWGINSAGARVEVNASDKNGIRPAISFSKSIEFILSNDIFEGKSIYVLK